MAESASTTSNSNTTEIETRFCVICSSEACNDIVKDESFGQMLDFYWRGIEVDVKPDMNRRFFLCIPCHEKINNFYQINDMAVYFDAKLKESMMSILTTNVKGLLTWQEKGLKLLPFQAEIMSRWGTKLERVTETANNAKAVLTQFTATLSKEEVTGKDTAVKPVSPSFKKPSSITGLNNPKRARSTNDNSDLENSQGDHFSDVDLGRQTGPQSSRLTDSSSTTGSNVGVVNAEEKNVGELDGKFECLYCLTAFDEQEQLISHKKQCGH